MTNSFVIRCVCSLAFGIVATLAHADFEEDYEKKNWQEIEVQLPPAPKKESLVSFYVSPTSDNRSYVDVSSVSVGEDGVVRYVLVIETAGGARNVSFEGMRCQTRQRRLYASGRLDGSWSKARKNEWEMVREAQMNRHYAALYLDFFCPDGAVVRSAADAVRALRTGYRAENRGLK